MKKIQISLTVLLWSFSLMGLQGQIAITTLGGDANGSGGNVAFTTGQVVYSAYTGSNTSATQGVQQPLEISEITGINSVKDITLDFSVYPNPTSEYLMLKAEDGNHTRLLYQLFDIQGTLLISKALEGSETHISMSHLTSATYILIVKENGQKIKSFKIIKK